MLAHREDMLVSSLYVLSSFPLIVHVTSTINVKFYGTISDALSDLKTDYVLPLFSGDIFDEKPQLHPEMDLEKVMNFSNLTDEDCSFIKLSQTLILERSERLLIKTSFIKKCTPYLVNSLQDSGLQVLWFYWVCCLIALSTEDEAFNSVQVFRDNIIPFDVRRSWLICDLFSIMPPLSLLMLNDDSLKNYAITLFDSIERDIYSLVTR